MSAFEVGDEVLILKPAILWQKTAVVQKVWQDHPLQDCRLYEVVTDDGSVWRVRGKDLQLLEVSKAA